LIAEEKQSGLVKAGRALEARVESLAKGLPNFPREFDGLFRFHLFDFMAGCAVEFLDYGDQIPTECIEFIKSIKPQGRKLGELQHWLRFGLLEWQPTEPWEEADATEFALICGYSFNLSDFVCYRARTSIIESLRGFREKQTALLDEIEKQAIRAEDFLWEKYRRTRQLNENERAEIVFDEAISDAQNMLEQMINEIEGVLNNKYFHERMEKERNQISKLFHLMICDRMRAILSIAVHVWNESRSGEKSTQGRESRSDQKGTPGAKRKYKQTKIDQVVRLRDEKDLSFGEIAIKLKLGGDEKARGIYRREKERILAANSIRRTD